MYSTQIHILNKVSTSTGVFVMLYCITCPAFLSWCFCCFRLRLRLRRRIMWCFVRIMISISYIICSFKKKSIDGCSCHWFSIIIFLLVFYGEKSNEWRKREIIRICFSWSSRQRLCIIYIISSLISIEIRQQYNNITNIFFLMFQLISTSTHEHYLYYFHFK